MEESPASGYPWMLGGALAFATMGTLSHAAGASCPWQVIALSRALLALVFATVIAVSSGAQLVLWKPRTLWIRSIAGSISLVCTFYAFTRLPVADVLTLTNMFPIWVALLSWPLLREAPSAQVWIAVASGIVGVVLIQQPHIAAGNFASLVALLSSFSTSVAMLGLHRLRSIHPWAIVVHFSGVGLLFCLVALFIQEGSLVEHLATSGGVIVLLLGVGVTATVGQLCLTKAFAAGEPAKVSVVGLTQVVFGMAFDYLCWNRTFGPMTLLGIVLVIAPTAWLLSR